MKKKPLIPFGWLPGHWGLVGKTRKIAQAEYELDGYELELELIDINMRDGPEKEYAILQVEKRYNMITPDAYERRSLAFIEDPKKKRIAELEYKHKWESMPDLEYEKEMATAKDESWVTIKNISPGENPGEGHMELDWNDKFVEELIAAGYEGNDESDTVNNWLSELCKNIAMEKYSGVGDFDDLMEGKSKKAPVSLNGKKEIK